jgi:hypothetical protein
MVEQNRAVAGRDLQSVEVAAGGVVRGNVNEPAERRGEQVVEGPRARGCAGAGPAAGRAQAAPASAAAAMTAKRRRRRARRIVTGIMVRLSRDWRLGTKSLPGIE